MVKRKYEWSRWFAQQRFTLRKGEDYTCSTAHMVQQVRNVASARQVKINIVAELRARPEQITVVLREPAVAAQN